LALNDENTEEAAKEDEAGGKPKTATSGKMTAARLVTHAACNDGDRDVAKNPSY
jgi:hypothetical protein